METTETPVTKEMIAQRIYAILESFGAPATAMRLDATFGELQIDSLDLVELAQIIDDEYGVELTPEDALKIQTIGDAVDLIASRLP